MSVKNNIFFIGPMGAGKSTIGKHVAELLNYDFYDSDKEIEKSCGAPIDWIFELEGEAGFRKREQKILSQLVTQNRIILATGGGIVLSSQNRKLLASRGMVVYLQVSIEQQFKRISHDKNRPLIQTNNPKKTLIEMMNKREALYQGIADYRVNTDNQGVKPLGAHIVEMLKLP